VRANPGDEPDLWPNAGATLSLRAQAQVMAAMERNGAWSPRADIATTKAIITLVHGTWGGKSQLAASDSAFCVELSKALEGDCEFQIFRWSGDNHHTARFAAGLRLRECIRETADRFPNNPHFIIAHSHGGNIAMYALRDEALASTVVGMITLATPFVHVTRRRIPPSLRDAVQFFDAGSVLLGSGILLGLFSLLFQIFGPPLLQMIGMVGSVVALALMFASLASKRFWCASDFGNHIDFEKAFALPTSLAPETLILKSAADEAHGVLSASSFISWFSNRFVGQIINIGVTIREHRAWEILMVAFLVMLPLGLVPVQNRLLENSDQARWLVAALIEYHRVPWLIFSSLLAFIYLNTFVLAVMSWCASRPFGAGIGFDVPLHLVISAEDTPPGGPWNVFSIPDSRNARVRATEGWAWMHSEAYAAPKAVAIISLWVKSGRQAGQIFRDMRQGIGTLVGLIDERAATRQR